MWIGEVEWGWGEHLIVWLQTLSGDAAGCSLVLADDATGLVHCVVLVQ